MVLKGLQWPIGPHAAVCSRSVHADRLLLDFRPWITALIERAPEFRCGIVAFDQPPCGASSVFTMDLPPHGHVTGAVAAAIVTDHQ